MDCDLNHIITLRYYYCHYHTGHSFNISYSMTVFSHAINFVINLELSLCTLKYFM